MRTEGYPLCVENGRFPQVCSYLELPLHVAGCWLEQQTAANLLDSRRWVEHQDLAHRREELPLEVAAVA